MNRTESPVSIDDIGNTFDQTVLNELNFSREDFINMATIAFNLLKNKLQKPKISAEDILLAFWNYNLDPSTEDDKYVMTSYFCLAGLILMNKKSVFDEKDNTIYINLTNYTINKYNENMSHYD